MQNTSPREAQLTEQLRVALEQIEALRQENKLLKEKVDLLLKRLFGAKSEKLSAEQLSLLLEGLEEPKKEPASCASSDALEAELNKVPAREPREAKSREARVPQNLPAVEEIIDPQEVKANPEQWRHIGEEVTEQLDYEPARYFRRRLIRRKYVKAQPDGKAPIIAELNTLQEGSIAAPGLLAHIITSKYCDHLPLYRQEQICESRFGIHIPRQSMSRWMALAAHWLRPVYDQIRIQVFDKNYVQVDETPVKYLCPGHGKTKQGYLWTCKQPRGDAFFTWSVSRSTATLDQIIPASFTGHVQCDAYSAYGAFAKSREGRVWLVGCLAHARRNFVEAKDNARLHACWVLWQMRNLYRIERRLRQQRAGPNLRQAVRAAEAKPIMNRIYKAISQMKERRRHLPESSMGKAIDYALEQWPLLSAYLEDGRLEIDNNLVENAIRPTAIGKKNWMFFGDAEAGEHSAILYTIIECCRRRGIDPFTYLRDALTRLPQMTNHQVGEMLPGAWAKSRIQRNQPLSQAA
jgi:transposase